MYLKKTLIILILATFLYPATGQADQHPEGWNFEWPNTDFTKHLVPFSDILSGGPPKDGIPSIDQPKYISIEEAMAEPSILGRAGLGSKEPVISIFINGEARAYPLRILTWHEIVNDELGGVPITVTFCPLCNSAIVFDRRLNGEILDFGTTGKLRNSDLVMYDRQTESWWQQFEGRAIIGELSGAMLKILPSRMESWANFRKRAPNGDVLIPNAAFARSYGRNPYVGYDTATRPFLYNGEMPKNINPMARVVAVGEKAWSLELLRKQGVITDGDVTIVWQTGQNSALDSALIENGRDIGNITVQREIEGQDVDIAHDITFAFVFHAFRPQGTILQ